MPSPGKPSTDLLAQRWVHSHEEDTEEGMVFRPATHRFAPSRGRRSFELKADGRLLEGGPGPTDRPEEAEGTWRLLDGDRLAFYRTGESGPHRMLQIASLARDRLVVKKPA